MLTRDHRVELQRAADLAPTNESRERLLDVLRWADRTGAFLGATLIFERDTSGWWYKVGPPEHLQPVPKLRCDSKAALALLWRLSAHRGRWLDGSHLLDGREVKHPRRAVADRLRRAARTLGKACPMLGDALEVAIEFDTNAAGQVMARLRPLRAGGVVVAAIEDS